MKKLLLSLAIAAIGANVMQAEDPIASIEFKAGSSLYQATNNYTSTWTSTDGMWIFHAFNNNNGQWDCIKAGWKTQASTPYIASGVAIPVEVSSIVVSIGSDITPADITSAKLLIADNAEFTNANESALKIPTKANSDWVIDVASPAKNKFYKVQFDIVKTSANGKALVINKIALYQNKQEVPVEPEPEPVETVSVNSVKEAIALGEKTNVTVNFSMTVGFVNNNNIFCYDAAGDWIQVYGANTYEVGSVIPAGWTGYYELYNNATPEFGLNSGDKLPASTSKVNFEPKVVAPADVTAALVNNVIKIKDVVFDKATPSTKSNFTGKVGDTELSFRNNYTIDAVVAGTYDVTVVVTVYNNVPSLYVIKYEGESADTPVDPTPTEVVTVKSVKEAIALGEKTNVTVDFSMTVGFVNNNNIFCYDAAGDWIQVYGANTYEVGSVIPAGWTGYYELYNNATPEFGLNSEDKLPASTSKVNFEPKVVAPADVTTALVNNVIKIKDVVFAEDTPSTKSNFTGKVGDTELSFRNNYTIDAVVAGTYDVTVVVTVYKDAPSLYVINYAPAGDSAIDEISADDNAEAVYFNLQGVKVANPENGLYIKVQGKKATKVVIK